MIECVILYRNINGAVGFIHKEDSDEIHVFASRDEALALALEHSFLQAVIYQIVELDEL